MPVTNVGTLPPYSDPALSPLRYDHNGSQPWLAGVEIECERCGFAKTLDAGESVGDGTHGDCGPQTAYHFVYKDGHAASLRDDGQSRSGWGTGIFVCPCCKKQIFFQRELPVN